MQRERAVEKTTTKVRYNVASPVEYEKNGKKETFWQQLGSAFEGDNSITVLLNGLPLNGKLVLTLPKETHV